MKNRVYVDYNIFCQKINYFIYKMNFQIFIIFLYFLYNSNIIWKYFLEDNKT